MTADTRVFELRTYVAVPGQLDALVARFRDHAVALFEKHGMTSIGYWTATNDDGGEPSDTLVYLVAHASREAAKASWDAFWADPEWAAARAGGQVTASATSTFLTPTDFSALR